MAKTIRAARPLGLILHRGKSSFDGKPYVVIMPLGKSSNAKTGGMLQTYIIRSHVHPVMAVRNGGDSSICGNCLLRGVFASRKRPGKGKRGRKCYVQVGQGPGSIYKAFRRGRYVDYDPLLHAKYIKGRMVRFGSYGEPVLIPLWLMYHLADLSGGKWTGYTHQWSDPRFAEYKRFLMASVHGVRGPDSAEHAHHLGWRTFRTDNGSLQKGEILCPASAEAGKRLTCFECGVCRGIDIDEHAVHQINVFIPPHGGKAVMTATKSLPAA
jgi:hypothetical protein